MIAVSVGLALGWSQNISIDIFTAALTMGGVIALHASVDLLNDYWDFKRGIDTATKRTKMSGGTGVLPEGLLRPEQVYRAGIGFLILGSLIGGYFVITDGVIIAAILGFAIISIYFYSTKIVDSGLAEIFVGIKGTMIVIGTYFIQNNMVSVDSIFSGIMIGILSSAVLFITSFPDYNADKSKGRKTLVIILGRQKASNVFWFFPSFAYMVIISCVAFGIFPFLTLISLVAMPLMFDSGIRLRRNHSDIEGLIPAMSATLKFSRITGVLFALGFVLSGLFIYT